MVADGHDHSTDSLDRVAHLVDASAWLAGAREYFCGVIEAATASASLGGMLKRRYSRSRDSARLRSNTRGPAAPTLTACGALSWRDLAAVLRQCQEADSLSAIERALARNALVWLQNVGVEPTSASKRRHLKLHTVLRRTARARDRALRVHECCPSPEAFSLRDGFQIEIRTRPTTSRHKP